MSRTGIRCRGAAGPGRDAEIVRNALAPFGFGRRGAIGGVAATRRCKGIAFVAASSRLPRGAPNDTIAISDSGH
jgi:hypothetical protein